MPKTSRRKQQKPQHLSNDEDEDEPSPAKSTSKNLISDNNGNIITTRSRSNRNYKDSEQRKLNQSPCKSSKKNEIRQVKLIKQSPVKNRSKKFNLSDSDEVICNGDEGIASGDEVVSNDNIVVATQNDELVASSNEHDDNVEELVVSDDSETDAKNAVDYKDVADDLSGNDADNDEKVMDTDDVKVMYTDAVVNISDGSSDRLKSGDASESLNISNNVDFDKRLSDQDDTDESKNISNNFDLEKDSGERDEGSPDISMLNDLEDERENNSDSGIIMSPSPHLANRTCEYCGAVKKSPADLQRHLRKHTGERPFICEICNRAFKAKRSLQNHQYSQHKIDHRKTSVVAQYPDGSVAMKHKLDTDCNLDGMLSKRFRSDDSVVDHDSMSSNSPVGSLHESPESGIEMVDNGKDRVCQICGKVCLKPSDLRRHMMCHTGEKPFKCDICGKPFRAKNSMHYHMKASHGVNVELSPGLEERYLRLKKQSRLNSLMSKLAGMEQDSGTTNLGTEIPQEAKSNFTNYISTHSPFHYNTAPNYSIAGLSRETTSLEDLKKEMSANACSISNFTDGNAVLDPETGLFKHHGYYIDPSNIPESDNDGVIQIVKPGKSLVGTEIVQESPFCKSRISVKNETVLVTRIDGVNLISGSETSLYKCYLCGKMFNHLAQIQCHLSMHFEKDIVVYECQICRDPFWFKFQVIQHIRKKHPHRLRNVSSGEHSGNVNEDSCAKDLDSEPHSETAEKILSSEEQNEDLSDRDSNQIDGENSLRQYYRGLKYRKNSNGSYICVICRKSFFREQSLLKHIKIHSGNSLYYCEDCGQAFNVYVQLRQHITQVHRIKANTNSKTENSGRSLLSSLLKKTSQNWNPVNSVLSQEIEKEKENIEKEKAKALLESEGIKEDVTVVLPCDPEDIKTENLDKSDNQKCWSESGSDTENDNEGGKSSEIISPKTSEIMTSPRTTMLSKLSKVLNKRKSKTPIQIKQEEEEEGTNNVENTDATAVKEENIPDKNSQNFLPVIPQFMLNGNMPMPTLTSQGLINPTLNSVLFANTLAASGNAQQFLQGAASSHAQQFLQGAAAAAAVAASGNAHHFLQGAAYLPALAASLQMNPMMGMPISVKVPNTEVSESEPEPVSVKKEPSSESPSPTSSSNADSWNKSNTAESSSADPSPNQSGDREQLVGYPRVQWSPSSDGSKPSLHWNQISADGRKVTSLSRTHSRLPIVNTPVNREKVCKPTTLPDGRTVYRCPFCSKDFLSYSDINRHMDFHEDIRPYKCNFCEYYARTNSQLKVHMMRHQGIRGFCCKLCNYKGVTQSDLNRHMKSQIHLLKSRNSCKHCGEGFVTAKNLERHTNGNCIVKVQEENGLGI